MEKKVFEAVALAMHDAGVEVATYVPSLGATDIYFNYCEVAGLEPFISFHEEVAYAIAQSAALLGRRSFSVLKTHGFMKAANAVSDSLFSGTTAGFVSIVLGDDTGIQSDSIPDTKAFIKGLQMPHRVPDLANVYNEVLECFELSEKYGLPYAIIIDPSETELPTKIRERKASTAATHARPPEYRRDITQHVLCPPFMNHQKAILDHKYKMLENKVEQDWTSIPKLPVRPIPDCLPDKWQWFEKQYRNLFSVFKSHRGKVVFGDTGMFTLFSFPPYNCIDISCYMGGSSPLAIGAHLVKHTPVWSISGDFAFIAAGHIGLPEAVARKIPLKIMILKNGIAQTTGGQKIPDGVLEYVLGSYKNYVRPIKNPMDKNEVADVFEEANSSGEMRIVVADYT